MRTRTVPDNGRLTKDAIKLSPKEPPVDTATEPSREQVVADLMREMEKLILSDAAVAELRKAKKAIECVYSYLQRERRRKKRSKHFQWLLAQMYPPPSPVRKNVLTDLRDSLVAMREQIEGHELPSDTGQTSLAKLERLVRTPTEPKYWREYTSYLNNKPVSEILREFHPQYDQLHGWEREKYFRKVYNAIKRLVEQYGGPPLAPAPPQF